MRKILLLYTGGTIGMDYTEQGLAPVPGLLPKLMQRLSIKECEVDIIEYPVLIDSAAITLGHWRNLVNDIAQYYEQYDGFVIIHGTDTMAFTGSMLAFALPGLSKPIVLTGSQLPLVHPRSDGWGNLMDALEAASQPQLTEVVLVFDRLVLRACRARKWDASGFRGFFSPNMSPLGEFGIRSSWYRERWLTSTQPFVPVTLHDVSVASFFLTPGVSSTWIGQMLQQQESLQGVVLLSYGNGNVPADPALLEGIRAATDRGVLVVNLSQSMRGGVMMGEYAVSLPLIDAGVIAGADMTPEAAVGKLTVLLSQDLSMLERRRWVACSLVGELTEEKGNEDSTALPEK